MAASNRVRNIGRALIFQGWNVEYFGLRGADVPKKNGRKFKCKGMIDRIHFTYPGMFSVRSSWWWLRRVDDFLGLVSVISLFINRKIKRQVDVVLLYSSNVYIGAFWIYFLHFLKIPVILEVCEWPIAVAQVYPEKIKQAKIFCNQIVPKADAVLPISKYIEREIKKAAEKKNKTLPSFKIPILIDVNEESHQVKEFPGFEFPYMLYCGSIGYFDIAKMVVDIIAELMRRGVSVPAVFTGHLDQDRFARLKEYANRKGVLDLFIFTGFISEEKLFSLMRLAVCLLAPLPKNSQSESRFPTKLGYYLSSEAPIVTNTVGEVNNYLKDGINAYVAKECQTDELVDKVISILRKPSEAKCVGKAGSKLAMDKFYFKSACKGLGEFFDKIIRDYVK